MNLFLCNSATGQGKDNTRYDIGGRNDIRLTYNQCGCVYEILLEDDFDSKTIRPLVCGTASTAVASNTCDVDGCAPADPDNLPVEDNSSSLKTACCFIAAALHA